MLLTAVFSLVMAWHLGWIRLFKSHNPNAVMPDFDNVMSVFLITQWLPLSVCISITLFGLLWRRRGIDFPSQPGHWLALFLAFSFLMTLLPTFSMLMQRPDYVDTLMFWGLTFANFLFHCFLVIFWSVAFLNEESPIWSWGWAAMAVRSLFLIFLAGLRVLVRLFEWLLVTFWSGHTTLGKWVTQPFHPSISFGLMILTNYVCLVFLVAATISDVRNHRRRHWSHWFVLICEIFAMASLSIYYHWAFNKYF